MNFSEAIINALMAYYTSEDWGYDLDTHHGTFSVEAQLECKLGSALMITQVTEDSFITYTILPVKASPLQRATVGEYLHRANYGLPRGNFEFDYDDGTIHYKTSFPCPDGAAPTQAQMEESIAIGLTVCDTYGDGLYDLINQEESPAKQAIGAING